MLYTLPILGHLAYFRAEPEILMKLQRAYSGDFGDFARPRPDAGGSVDRPPHAVRDIGLNREPH